MMLSCRGGSRKARCSFSDLASARKFMGWPALRARGEEGWYHQGEAVGEGGPPA